MKVKSSAFWKRIKSTFRKDSGTGSTEQEELPRAGKDGLLSEPAETVPGDGDAEAPSDRSAMSLPRWSKRDQTLAKLQEGYEQVTNVMSEIQNHLVAQNDRSERICASLEKLADSMGDAPANARQQAQSLETIAAQMEATRTHTQNLATSLSDLPTVARNQGEALKSIHRQLEVSGEQSAMTTQTMDRLGTAINSLSSSNDLQAERLRQMSDHNDEQTERLTSMLARQNKHFLMLFVVTAVLAAAAVAAVTVLAFQIAKI